MVDGGGLSILEFIEPGFQVKMEANFAIPDFSCRLRLALHYRSRALDHYVGQKACCDISGYGISLLLSIRWTRLL